MYEYLANVIRVIDADTIEVTLDLGFHTYRVEHIRITYPLGKVFDAPETKLYEGVTQAQKEHGLEAKHYAEQILWPGRQIKIKTFYDKTGKYGRFLGAVELENGTDYANHMSGLGYTKKEEY